MFIRTAFGSYINLNTVTYIGIISPVNGGFVIVATSIGENMTDNNFTRLTKLFSSREEAQKELDFFLSSWGFSNKPLGTIINTVDL